MRIILILFSLILSHFQDNFLPELKLEVSFNFNQYTPTIFRLINFFEHYTVGLSLEEDSIEKSSLTCFFFGNTRKRPRLLYIVFP